MVHSSTANSSQEIYLDKDSKRHAAVAQWRKIFSSGGKDDIDSFENLDPYKDPITYLLLKQGVPKDSIPTIRAAWSEATKKSYTTHLRKWVFYCEEKGVNCVEPNRDELLSFLKYLKDNPKTKHSLAGARSALTNIFSVKGINVMEDFSVRKFIKGAENQKQVSPKLLDIWDPSTVLNMLDGWGPLEELNIRQLTFRTLMLFLLATGQRGQTAWLLKHDDFRWYPDKLIIVISEKLKTNKPYTLSFTFEPWVERKNLCVFSHFQEYLGTINSIKAKPWVFGVINGPPYHRAKRDTLANYVRQVFKLAGLDEKFSPHTVRHTSTSKAKANSVPIPEILKSAGWKKESTFAKFYNRPIQAEKITNFLPCIA